MYYPLYYRARTNLECKGSNFLQSFAELSLKIRCNLRGTFNVQQPYLKSGSLMLHIFKRPLGIPLSRQTSHQLGVLAMFTAYCISLVALRYVWTGKGAFTFLGWNLFLAWMPVFFSTLAEGLTLKRNKLLVGALLFIPWLLFLPNAPYIITDLVHLRPRPNVPYWYDILLMTSFAFNGLLLGFFSMKQMHHLLADHVRPAYAWAIMLLSSIGAAYGIYLGRVLRWNSWDILRHPMRLAMDCLQPFIHPFAHKEAVVMTIVLSGFLFAGYLALRSGLSSVKAQNP